MGLFLGLSDLFCVGCWFSVWIGGLTREFAGVFADEWLQVFDLAALGVGKNKQRQPQQQRQ
jgi:hypothetical protein